MKALPTPSALFFRRRAPRSLSLVPRLIERVPLRIFWDPQGPTLGGMLTAFFYLTAKARKSFSETRTLPVNLMSATHSGRRCTRAMDHLAGGASFRQTSARRWTRPSKKHLRFKSSVLFVGGGRILYF